jgi:glyoxylase-like metal-dependent hydrolase (beta-lactamase superfamily II)
MAITRIHHLNCGTMCPAAAPLINGPGRSFRERGTMVCHCLLIETTSSGLILVDTGFGTDDCTHPQRFHRAFRVVASPRFDVAETALSQITELGYAAADVRHLVVTHLDLDHAGGLGDFPHADVHLHAVEKRAALTAPTLAERGRYIQAQWSHGPSWRTYEDAGDDWFGFEAVRQLDGVAEQLALIPLFGHTRGHCGVAVQHEDGWLLHAGDAYFHHDELIAANRCPPGLRLFQELVQMNRRKRIDNANRLRELSRHHAGDVTIFSAHDPAELHQFTQ